MPVFDALGLRSDSILLYLLLQLRMSKRTSNVPFPIASASKAVAFLFGPRSEPNSSGHADDFRLNRKLQS
jgi:hypothetical protein